MVCPDCVLLCRTPSLGAAACLLPTPLVPATARRRRRAQTLKSGAGLAAMERDRLPRQPGLAAAARVEGAQQRQYCCYGRAWVGAATVLRAPRVSAATVVRAPTAHRPSNSCGGHARLASPPASLGPRATSPPRHPPYAWPYHNSSVRQLHPAQGEKNGSHGLSCAVDTARRPPFGMLSKAGQHHLKKTAAPPPSPPQGPMVHKKTAAPPPSPPQGPMVPVPNVVRPARQALGFTSSLSASRTGACAPRTPPSRTRSLPTSPHPG